MLSGIFDQDWLPHDFHYILKIRQHTFITSTLAHSYTTDSWSLQACGLLITLAVINLTLQMKPFSTKLKVLSE